MTNEEGKELLDVLMDAGAKVTNARYKTALKKEVATVRFVDGGDVYIRPVSDMSTPTVITPTSVSDLDPGDIAMPNITWQLLSFGDIVEVVYAQSLNDGCIIRKVGVASSDFIAMSGATFMGTVDVVQRRAYGTLSSAGWYRVLTYNANELVDVVGAEGLIIDFNIVRVYGNGNNEVHYIRLLGVYNNFIFVNESSRSNVLQIDKIRYAYNSTTHVGYVDIHYTNSLANAVTVAFDVKTRLNQQGLIVASGLESVADAPVGETIVTTYTFTANGFVPNQSIINPYGNLAETGHRVATNPSAVSVSSSTYKTVASLTLSAGMWCVFVTVQWAYSSTGRRRAFLSTTQDSSSANVGIMYTSEIKALNDGSANTYVNFAGPLEVSASTTYYVNTWQNSGGALSTTGRFYAMKIA